MEEVPAEILCQICASERPGTRPPNIIMCPIPSHREGICEKDMLYQLAQYFPDLTFDLNEGALLGIH